jgi:hypothetical protein
LYIEKGLEAADLVVPHIRHSNQSHCHYRKLLEEVADVGEMAVAALGLTAVPEVLFLRNVCSVVGF